MAEQSFDYCIRALATDVGRKRSANEDFLGERVTPNGLVTVVCDGMGGHVGGAIASHIAVDTILDYLTQNIFDNPNDAIVAAVSQANNAILQRTVEDPSLTGMGSTCVMIIVRDGLVYYGWVGDSRIYLVRQNSINQLSKDQSVVQALVDAGQLTPAEAEHHARKNEITNCLGIATMTPAVVGMRPIQPQAGDSFLLCSDGLSGMVNDRTIAEIISNRSQMRLQQRAEQLIAEANANGGLDNITALLLEFPSGSMSTEYNSGRITVPASRTNARPYDVGTAKAKTSSQRNIMLWGGIGLASLLITGALVLFFLPDKDQKPDNGANKGDDSHKTATNNDGTGVEEVKPFNDVTIIQRVPYEIKPEDFVDTKNVKSVINFVHKDGLWEVQTDAGDEVLSTFSGSLTSGMIKVSEGFTVEPDRKGPNKGIISIYPVGADHSNTLTVTIDQALAAKGTKTAETDKQKEGKEAKAAKEAEAAKETEATEAAEAAKKDGSSPVITFKITLIKSIITSNANKRS